MAIGCVRSHQFAQNGMDAFPRVIAEFLSESLKFNRPLITESKVDHEVLDCIQINRYIIILILKNRRQVLSLFLNNLGNEIDL
jgi:hypothetical protein